MSSQNCQHDFELAWKCWPGRLDDDGVTVRKVGKAQAKIIWKRMSCKQHEWAIAAINAKKWPEKYLPDMFRWLRDKRYEDYELITVKLIKAEEKPMDIITPEQKAELKKQMKNIFQETTNADRI